MIVLEVGRGDLQWRMIIHSPDIIMPVKAASGWKMESNVNNTFGNKLNSLKIARGLKSVELAHRAGISEGLLSGLIHDHRVIGEYTARKIGNALQLPEDELEEFVYSAINNCSEKILESSKKYPAELINLVAAKLQQRGIAPDEISRCVRKGEDADAALYLNDGSEARITLEVAIR